MTTVKFGTKYSVCIRQNEVNVKEAISDKVRWVKIDPEKNREKYHKRRLKKSEQKLKETNPELLQKKKLTQEQRKKRQELCDALNTKYYRNLKILRSNYDNVPVPFRYRVTPKSLNLYTGEIVNVDKKTGTTNPRHKEYIIFDTILGTPFFKDKALWTKCFTVRFIDGDKTNFNPDNLYIDSYKKLYKDNNLERVNKIKEIYA